MSFDPTVVHDGDLPPQNVEAEESILGGILLDPKAMERVADFLIPDAFYVRAHADIYRAALTLFSQGKPTDLMLVTTFLQDRQQLEAVGGTSKLALLVDRTVSALNIDRYAALVVDKYLRRQLIGEAREIAAEAWDSSLELAAVIDRAEQRIFAVAQHRPAQDVESVGEILVRNFQEIEEYARGVSQPGLNTGLTEIDRITGGLQRQDLIVIGGRLSPGEMDPLTWAIGYLSDLPIFIDDSANPSVFDIRAKVRRVAAKHGPLGLVLVDYLQLMSGGSGSSNRVQELERLCCELKQMAKDFNVPVMCLSQLHRGVEGRQDKRPLMSDLRDSGGIEQAADLVALLYRENYYQPDSPERGIVEVNFAKHRNGPTGVV